MDEDGNANNPELISSLESQVSDLDGQINGLRDQIESLQAQLAAKMEQAKEKEDKITALVGQDLPAAQAKDRTAADDAVKAEKDRMEADTDRAKEASENPPWFATLRR